MRTVAVENGRSDTVFIPKLTISLLHKAIMVSATVSTEITFRA
jgi:hypothetical protein